MIPQAVPSVIKRRFTHPTRHFYGLAARDPDPLTSTLGRSRDLQGFAAGGGLPGLYPAETGGLQRSVICPLCLAGRGGQVTAEWRP